MGARRKNQGSIQHFASTFRNMAGTMSKGFYKKPATKRLASMRKFVDFSVSYKPQGSARPTVPTGLHISLIRPASDPPRLRWRFGMNFGGHRVSLVAYERRTRDAGSLTGCGA